MGSYLRVSIRCLKFSIREHSCIETTGNTKEGMIFKVKYCLTWILACYFSLVNWESSLYNKFVWLKKATLKTQNKLARHLFSVDFRTQTHIHRCVEDKGNLKMHVCCYALSYVWEHHCVHLKQIQGLSSDITAEDMVGKIKHKALNAWNTTITCNEPVEHSLFLNICSCT